MSTNFELDASHCNETANTSVCPFSVSGNGSLENYMSENITDGVQNSLMDPFAKSSTRIVIVMIYVTVFVLCVLGNSIVLFVLTKDIRMRTRTNIFLANLAVADLSIGVFCVLPTLYRFLFRTWHFGQFLCRMYKFVENLNLTASMLLLEVIAFERYIAINHPLKARRLFTQYKVYFASLLVWLVSGIYNIPFFIVWNAVELGENHNNLNSTIFCVYSKKYFKIIKIYFAVNFSLWYVVPLITMSVLYIKIGHTLWRSGVSNQMVALRKRVSSVASSSYSDDLCQPSTGRVTSIMKRPRSLPDILSDSSETLPNKDAESSHGAENEYIANSENFSATDDKISQAKSGSERLMANLKSRSRAGMAFSKGVRKLRRPKKKRERTHEFAAVSTTDDITQENSSLKLHSSSVSESSEDFNTHKAENVTIPLHDIIPPTRHQIRKIPTSKSASSALSLKVIGRPSSNSNTSASSICRYRVTSQRSSRRRVIRLLLIVLITFAVLVLPNHIRLLFITLGVRLPSSEASAIFSIACPLLMYFNSAVNPILYSLLSQSFRRGLKETMVCWKMGRKKKRITHANRTDISSISNTRRTSF